MGEHTRRVVGGFEDPREADEARHRLRAEHPDLGVEQNAAGDADVAFALGEDRGDSIEQQPDITVAVEVPGGEAGDDAAGLADEGADVTVVEPSRRT